MANHCIKMAATYVTGIPLSTNEAFVGVGQLRERKKRQDVFQGAMKKAGARVMNLFNNYENHRTAQGKLPLRFGRNNGACFQRQKEQRLSSKDGRRPKTGYRPPTCDPLPPGVREELSGYVHSIEGGEANVTLANQAGEETDMILSVGYLPPNIAVGDQFRCRVETSEGPPRLVFERKSPRRLTRKEEQSISDSLEKIRPFK